MTRSKSKNETAILETANSISVNDNGFEKFYRTVYFLGKLWVNRKPKSYL
jgi:hypothetical protein